MGHVIPLHGDPHDTTQRLLPWYVTGTLEPGEVALVERHLADCPDCRAELESERRLRAELAMLPPPDAGQWEALRARAMATAPAGPVPMARRRLPRWIGIAASHAAILLIGIAAYDALRPRDEAAYHALSAGPIRDGAAPANVIVVFRPDASEQALRGAINAADARLVDGPTAAGAYVLAVPAAERETALRSLRARAEIVLAQPIDGNRPR